MDRVQSYVFVNKSFKELLAHNVCRISQAFIQSAKHLREYNKIWMEHEFQTSVI